MSGRTAGRPGGSWRQGGERTGRRGHRDGRQAAGRRGDVRQRHPCRNVADGLRRILASRSARPGRIGFRSGDHDQVGWRSTRSPRSQRHGRGEQHRPGRLAGQQLGDVIGGRDRQAGDGGNKPPMRGIEHGIRQHAAQRGLAPDRGGAMLTPAAAQQCRRDTLRAGAQHHIADGGTRAGQHVRPGVFVDSDLDTAGPAQPGCRGAVTADPDQRGRTAGACPQHLTAQRGQPHRLPGRQAASPDQPGDLAEAVSRRGIRRYAQLFQLPQCGQRGGQQPGVLGGRGGQSREHQRDRACGAGRDGDAWFGQRHRRAAQLR